MLRIIDYTRLDENRWQLRITDGIRVIITVARPALFTRDRWEFYAFGRIHILDDNFFGKEA